MSDAVWFSSFGRLAMSRAGDVVRGTYEHNGGRVEGRVDGSVARGQWSETSKSGPFEIEFEHGENTFRGRWKYAGDSDWRGPWNGVRVDAPVEGDGRSLGSWNGQAAGPLIAGPMLGEASQHELRIWAQARDASPLELVVEAADGAQTRVVAAPDRSEWCCVTFVVENLVPGASYAYWIESAHGTTARSRCRTAPSDDARRARVAFGSCYDVHEEALPIFDAIAAERPDVVVMAGDNCYYMEPDWQSEHTMMLAQLRNRNNPTFASLGASVSVLGIWDDHDFGPNDSDGRFAGKPSSLRVFKRAWAQRAYGIDGVPGIFSTVRFGPVEMFLLDGRYERLEKEQILGPRQMQWFKDRLAASTAPVKLVVSGSQLLPLAAVEKEWECWRRDSPRELEELLSFVAERDIRGVVYASGDVHLGYLLHEAGRVLGGGRVGPETWELTASPLSNAPWHETILRPGQPYDPYIVSEFAEQNYGVVDVDLDRTGHEIHLVLKNGRGGVLVDQPIPLVDLAVGPATERKQVAMPGAPSTDGPRTPKTISAALVRGRTVHFFRGDDCIVFDLDARAVTGSSPLTTMYPGATKRGVDAAVVWPNGKLYCFAGERYMRFDLGSNETDAGFPLRIADHWPGVFREGVDAAIVWNAEKAFFFCGSEYVRYDIASDRVDQGYPRAIAGNWPGVFADGVDCVIGPSDGKAWFIRGSECTRYDVAADRADPGYPRPLAEEWPIG